MKRDNDVLLPKLSNLRCFEAAARYESFTQAAEELCITQGAVSRKVKDLELELGFKLFRRVGRSVVLTEEGRKLSTQLSDDLNRLRQTLFQAISAGGKNTALRIATLPTFASRWLIPHLADFTEQFPDIELKFGTRLEPFDFEREAFDLAVHFGNANWPKTKITHLSDEQMVAVSSVSLFESYGLDDPAAATQAPLLHLETRPHAWTEWFSAAEIRSKPMYRGKYFDQFSMVIAAAVNSLGIALVPFYLIVPELRSGALRRIHGPAVATDKSYFLVRPYGTNNPNSILFENWIRREIRSHTSMIFSDVSMPD